MAYKKPTIIAHLNDSCMIFWFLNFLFGMALDCIQLAYFFPLKSTGLAITCFGDCWNDFHSTSNNKCVEDLNQIENVHNEDYEEKKKGRQTNQKMPCLTQYMPLYLNF